MKNKVVAFTIADQANLKYAQMMERSLRNFHTEEELPLVIVGSDKIKLTNDPAFFYRAKPAIARDLIKEYETVIGIDADSVITGNIEEAWKGDWDVAVVGNSNPRELKTTGPISVWNIDPLAYVNAGFVAMKSESFVNHWWGLCTSPHFGAYQFKEQDLLNIMCFYMNFNMGGPYKFSNLEAGNEIWGLRGKGYWLDYEIRDSDLMLPKQEDGWVNEDKQIKVIHVAGGNMPNKMNFWTYFKPEVARYLKNLTS